jgi:hypothetical protein
MPGVRTGRDLFSRSRVDTRNDLLFTMSDITRLSHTHEIRAHESIDAGSRELLCLDEPSRLTAFAKATAVSLRFPTGLPAEAAEQRRLVEPDGIEPTTSCLQSRRSPS